MELQFSLDTIDQAARQFWAAAGQHRVFAFHAPMGIGKTTFIAALCRAKGVQQLPSSPTFSIINEYRTDSNVPLFHMDLYRLRDEEEARQAGVEDCLFSGEICLVEWPEKAPGIFPPDTLHVQLEIYTGNKADSSTVNRLKTHPEISPETRYLRTFTEA